MRATFTGHEPARDDGLRQIPVNELTPEERAAVERFTRDIEKHLATRNRHDEERRLQRRLQRELYRGLA